MRMRILVSAVTEVEYSVQEGASVKSPLINWKEKHEVSRKPSVWQWSEERSDWMRQTSYIVVPYGASSSTWRERDHDSVYRIKQGQQQALQVDQSGQKQCSMHCTEARLSFLS